MKNVEGDAMTFIFPPNVHGLAQYLYPPPPAPIHPPDIASLCVHDVGTTSIHPEFIENLGGNMVFVRLILSPTHQTEVQLEQPGKYFDCGLYRAIQSFGIHDF